MCTCWFSVLKIYTTDTAVSVKALLLSLGELNLKNHLGMTMLLR